MSSKNKHCVEIVYLTVTDVYHADPNISQPAFSVITTIPGMVTGYSGLDIADKYTWILFQGTYPKQLPDLPGGHCSAYPLAYPQVFNAEWESFEHHQAFMDDKPTYSQLLNAMGKFTNGYKILHVNFNMDPNPALLSTFTQMLVLKLEDVAKKQLIVDEIVALLTGSESSNSIHSWAFGDVNETGDETLILVGWETPQIIPDVEYITETLRPFSLMKIETRTTALTAFM
ncbi:hypothetical protein C8Q75DRAFT_106354 [Abortiporus biennis]|nr:hypothetical protein C8Q75DRAFT_106354 [Abortiporus biennis]